MEAGKVVSSDGIEPLRQPFALALGEHLAEGADVAGEGVQFRALDQNDLSRRCSASLRVPGRRRIHPATTREPILPEIDANPLVAALVAERHDLFTHGPGVRAALVPAVIQVGLEGVESRWPTLPLPVEQVLRVGCVGEGFDGAGGHAELVADCPPAEPGCQ